MKILVINAGSSSLKYQLIDMENEKVIAKGLCERIAIDGSRLTHKANGKEYVFTEDMPNHTVAIKMVLNALVDKECGVIASMDEIAAVGHRMVHGAEDYNTSVLVTDDVLRVCRENIDLAPLHNPANIMGIEACKAIMPDVPMVVVFDTAFHATMPEKAYLYGIPYDDYKNYRVRKYGFHGTSHMFVAGEAAAYMGRDIKDLKIVTCHLGNGSSVSAVDGGKSVETSMGFTPLEGLPMGTRSGNIDPAAIEYLMNKKGMTISEMINYLNKKSGMLGLSGHSSDFRDLVEGDALKDPRNKLAVDIFAYRVKKYIGSYAAAMGGLDCVAFTGGIGEHTEIVREKVMSGLEFLGIDFDYDKNNNVPRGEITLLTKPASKVKVYIIPTNEELVIARETLRLK